MGEQTADGDGLGSLAEEATRLLGAVQDWAARTFPDPADRPDSGGHSSDCQWCPLCQFVGVLRGERPDVTERVAEAGTALVTALRAVVDAVSGAGAASAAAHRAPGPSSPGRPRVQRIDLLRPVDDTAPGA
jgi:hypothetical protein